LESEEEKMKAVVLAAGLGKRMRPLTNDMPKALVKLKGRPLLEHVLQSLERAGVKQAVVVVGFKGGLIRERFGNRFGKLKLSYVLQRIPMGTAHAVLKAKGKVGGKFLVASADVIVQASLWKKLSEKKGFDAVVALRRESRPERFGIAIVSGKKLMQIVEKPLGKIESSLVNAGAYALSEKIFPVLRKTRVSSRGEFELTDSINALAAKGKVGFVVYKGKCLDISDLPALRKAEKT
jgi:bifunctional UDP-N-acetylglucosamine pyrophosphorylase/glucosamine-1-phosphate N-acetyltransferase